MENAAAEEGEQQRQQQQDQPEENRLILLPGSTDSAASFCFLKEDHTLGNALRYVIARNPQVEFCGYTLPHPSEDKMHLRIQTYETENVSVFTVLEKGLNDLAGLCDVVLDEFTTARDEFMRQPQDTEMQT